MSSGLVATSSEDERKLCTWSEIEKIWHLLGLSLKIFCPNVIKIGVHKDF